MGRRPLGLRQGAVLEAVTEILRGAEKPMRARDVRAAAEAVLGTSIPPSSVQEALSTHARTGDLRFRRVAFGVYEHRRQASEGSNLPKRSRYRV